MNNDTCKNCGAALNGKPFCTQCGAPAGAAEEPPGSADGQAAAQNSEKALPELILDDGLKDEKDASVPKTYEEPPVKTEKPEIPPGYAFYDEPPADSKYALVPAKSFFWLYILFSVPLVGWFVCIVMALGGCRNRNKRNFARAVFMLYLLFILLACVATVIIYLFKPDMLQNIIDWFMYYNYMEVKSK
jgi:hypothetical protein